MRRHAPKHPIDQVLDAANGRNETLRSHTLEVAIDFERLVCLVLGTESIPDEWRPKLMAPAAAAAAASIPVVAFSNFLLFVALVGGFCTPPALMGGDDENVAIDNPRGGSLRFIGGLNALKPLFGDPM